MGSARRLIVFIAALSLALQAYFTQTHMHGAFPTLGIGKVAVPQLPAPVKTPLDHGPAACPFCQAVVHAGAFVTPASSPLHLPFVFAEIMAPAHTARPDIDAFAHDWQSRAPPAL